MNKLIWVAQALLACAFLAAAGLKLFAFGMMAAKSPGTSDLHGMFIFVAFCEIAGAIGLIFPMLMRFAPMLTAWAATGLAMIVLLAAGFHLGRRELGELPGCAVLFLLAAFVVWGRGFSQHRAATAGDAADVPHRSLRSA